MPRQRRESLSHLNTVAPVPIELTDGTVSASQFDDSSRITDVLVGDYHIISGDSAPQYVVWSIRIVVNGASHSSIVLYKRYSDIEQFRGQLVAAFPDESIPQLPPKDNFSLSRLWFSDSWLETRRRGLQWFMTNVLLNPRYQHSPVITQFVLRQTAR
ncbi:hypothetical protein FT663_01415 [Candidozyma haemuli var. vulneris]|uniref:Endosomal/vacuolar adapter protein YPT35 n=1 Tax=Candidozyma haemuli TaxID=45357 RepID=A0A2V1AYR9_9ASCO|nr:hypothetical protein CXQ85_002743 [[Candida] haemuloni]KAF3992550.1 hypothetical protein FT662_01096 [[Candida] haemuloni var. vulneris]KAF3994502.1 hypothetical protein FT663_01415 [[Candida] haemuloni var. vulneris]PVH23018.1 hypothetical protein CXQ85_002743 [[Candida] haemuloni]